MTTIKNHAKKSFIPLGIAFLLAACGGGGASSGSGQATVAFCTQAELVGRWEIRLMPPEDAAPPPAGTNSVDAMPIIIEFTENHVQDIFSASFSVKIKPADIFPDSPPPPEGDGDIGFEGTVEPSCDRISGTASFPHPAGDSKSPFEAMKSEKL